MKKMFILFAFIFVTTSFNGSFAMDMNEQNFELHAACKKLDFERVNLIIEGQGFDPVEINSFDQKGDAPIGILFNCSGLAFKDKLDVADRIENFSKILGKIFNVKEVDVNNIRSSRELGSIMDNISGYLEPEILEKILYCRPDVIKGFETIDLENLKDVLQLCCFLSDFKSPEEIKNEFKSKDEDDLSNLSNLFWNLFDTYEEWCEDSEIGLSKDFFYASKDQSYFPFGELYSDKCNFVSSRSLFVISSYIKFIDMINVILNVRNLNHNQKKDEINRKKYLMDDSSDLFNELNFRIILSNNKVIKVGPFKTLF